MALKDWKEITQIKGGFYDRLWKNKKNGNVLILSQAYHNQVVVESRKNKRIYDSGWLKTKSEALRYAKAYMRKN
tara:strand:- start:2301 stop:2522 length:222 start_codon:yes stop_codon:yes gene_type:complete